MRDILDTRIKHRERFRPFAPSIVEGAIDDYPMRPGRHAEVPAITHMDGSGRLHTVSRRSNQRYYNLIKAFERQTGLPMLLNTFFNEKEPIVRMPEQALDCFLRTHMDVLVMGRYALERSHVADSCARRPLAALEINTPC
jgi:carbamoyltransferase